MRIDEENTINTWWLYRLDIAEPTVEKFSGRIVKLTGGGFLAEFATATDAVLTAYTLQKCIESCVKKYPKKSACRFASGLCRAYAG